MLTLYLFEVFQYVAKAGLKLLILLSRAPESWNSLAWAIMIKQFTFSYLKKKIERGYFESK